VEADCEPKIQRCSPSIALVMAILASSILSPCIRAYGKAEKLFTLLTDGEHLCGVSTCGNRGVHSSYGDSCILNTEPYVYVHSEKLKNFLNYFQMVNTSVLCCGVSACAN